MKHHRIQYIYLNLLIILPSLILACGSDTNDESDESQAGTEMMAEAGTEMMAEAGTEMTAEAGTEMTAEAGTEMTAEAGTEMMTDSVWGMTCTENSDCSSPTDFCVKQPGMAEGYCTFACTNNQECTDLEAPSDWSCNTLNFSGCEDIPSNWCGPQSELTDFPGIIIECQ